MTTNDWVVGTLGLVLFVLPGWLLAKGLRVPHPTLAGFISSVVAIVWLILGLEAVSARVSFRNCAVMWIGATLVLAWWARQKLRRAPTKEVGPSFSWADHWPLLLPLAPIVAVVVYRAGAQALFGIDTVFRWNYLAEQILARGSMAFYPPVSAADYEIYSWPDGIAPAVSAPYFWHYAFAGVARRGLTAPFVLLQFGLIVLTAFGLARQLFSDRAAAFSVALIACSPTIAWATAMGQETGLTALSFAAVLLYLPRNRTEETTGTLMCAGLAAALGALAREYGAVVTLIGLMAIGVRRLSWGALVIFSLGAATALPWYIRNWVRTGNPVFNLEVSSWFPINQEHAWLMESFGTQFGWSSLPSGATAYVLRNCWVILLLGVAGGVVYFRHTRALIVVIGAVVVLWAVSVGYTAAGFTNTLRVLSPALLILAVLGGGLAARLIPRSRYLGGASIALTLLGCDSALRALTLPGNVYKIPFGEWLNAGGAVHEYHARQIYREFVRVAAGHRILVLGPNALLASQGARTLPLWSPEVRFLFEDNVASTEVARRLAAADIAFVLLNKGAVNERYLARSAFFRDPAGMLRPVWADHEMIFHQVVSSKD